MECKYWFFYTFLLVCAGTDNCCKVYAESLNSTLFAISDNEKILFKGLEDMTKHINKQDGEVKRMFMASSMMLTVNEHSMQQNRAIDECRREYEILIDAIMNLQKGVLQPQIITRAEIMKHMKASQADMPPELSLPLL